MEVSGKSKDASSASDADALMSFKELREAQARESAEREARRDYLPVCGADTDSRQSLAFFHIQ
jgi:hypothetical protein